MQIPGGSHRTAEPHDDARAERKTGERVPRLRITLAQPVERRPGVFEFADGIRVHALAGADAAEIEPKNSDTGAPQASCDAIHDLIVHGAAVEWMRMTDHSAESRGISGIAEVFWLFQQGFHPPGGEEGANMLD